MFCFWLAQVADDDTIDNTLVPEADPGPGLGIAKETPQGRKYIARGTQYLVANDDGSTEVVGEWIRFGTGVQNNYMSANIACLMHGKLKGKYQCLRSASHWLRQCAKRSRALITSTRLLLLKRSSWSLHLNRIFSASKYPRILSILCFVLCHV